MKVVFVIAACQKVRKAWTLCDCIKEKSGNQATSSFGEQGLVFTVSPRHRYRPVEPVRSDMGHKFIMVEQAID